MKKDRFDKRLVVSAYGVRVEILTNNADALPVFRKLFRMYLPECEISRSHSGSDRIFYYTWNRSAKDTLRDNEAMIARGITRADLLDLLGSSVRLTVAEYAEGRVFIHAGAVEWKGRAIIIPARSFKGKSALTAELVKLGARYYSDEYAVLDLNGRVHPFPKKLSLRGTKNHHERVHVSAESLGGKIGKRPIPVGVVIVTEYRRGARWKPIIVERGKGAMALINNAVSIRRDPQSALAVIGKVVAGAVILRSKRGEAAETAAAILEAISSDAISG